MSVAGYVGRTRSESPCLRSLEQRCAERRAIALESERRVEARPISLRSPENARQTRDLRVLSRNTPPPRSSNNVILLISLGYFQTFPPTRRHEDDEAVSDPLKSLMSAKPHQSIDVTTCRAHVDTSDLLARRKALTLGVIAPVASPRARDSLSKRPLRKTTLRSLWRDHLVALSLFFSFFLLDKRYRQGRGEGEA